MTDRKYLGINSVVVDGVSETNLLDVDIWLMDDKYGEDLVEMQFAKGTISSVGFKQGPTVWLIKIVHDGWTDLWDSYIAAKAKGAEIPSFVVIFDIVKAGEATTEVWTFTPNKCWIADRDERSVEIEQERTPGTIYVVSLGDPTVTHV